MDALRGERSPCGRTPIRPRGASGPWGELEDVTATWLRGFFPQEKWDDFLSLSPWFDENKNRLREQVERFRRTERLAVATYGLSQDADMASDFTEKSIPWLLNSLFCPYTVQPGKDGLPGRNNVWIREFRALQRR